MNFWYKELTNEINYTAYLQNEESLQTQNQLHQSALSLLTKRYVMQSTPPPPTKSTAPHPHSPPHPSAF